LSVGRDSTTLRIIWPNCTYRSGRGTGGGAKMFV
jgi:hypothetical protein